MAASVGWDDILDLLMRMSLEDEDPEALLLQATKYLPKADIIRPQWADKEPWVRQTLRRFLDVHGDGGKDPREDCWIEAYNSNDLSALWSCGMYDHRTLPYLYTPEAKVFPSTRPPAQPWKSRIPLPGHRIYDRGAKLEQVTPGTWFRTCYACAGIFEYVLDDHNSAYIWAGVPPPDIEYIAISYVWGDVKDLTIACSTCNHLTQFPFASITKFQEIMALVGPERVAWVDAISIDQGDIIDLKSQMAQMGSLYKHAITVSVFLPQSDEEGYRLLETLSRLAKKILSRPTEFMVPREKRRREGSHGRLLETVSRLAKKTLSRPTKSMVPREKRRKERSHGKQASIQPDALIAETGETPLVHQQESKDMDDMCSSFLVAFDKYRERSPRFRYWQRAWTFQEWCSATDLEIFIEGCPSYEPLRAVKTSIFSAASLLCQHRIMGCYGVKVRLDISYSSMSLWFEDVKHCFPLEDYMLTVPERDHRVYQYQCQLPHMGCDQLLGLRTQPRETQQEMLRARLHIMLTAFDRTRSARLEADLVACWATMCNLQYEYIPEENIMSAVVKAIRAIRNAGLEIFEFFPHLHDQSIRHDCLSKFFLFAERQAIQNCAIVGWGSRKDAMMYDSVPVFSGRSDPFVHLQQSLLQDFSRFSGGLDNIPYPRHYGRDPVQMVRSVIPSTFARVSSLEEATAIWKENLYGWSAEPLFEDMASAFAEVIRGGTPEICSAFNIVQYHIAAHREDGSSGVLRAWAITPVAMPISKLVTVRRERDGVFALVCPSTCGGYMEIAYLTVTDHISGTILVRSDEVGMVNLRFDGLNMRDAMLVWGPEKDSRSPYETRYLRARVTLEPWLGGLLPRGYGYHREAPLQNFTATTGCRNTQGQTLQRRFSI